MPGDPELLRRIGSLRGIRPEVYLGDDLHRLTLPEALLHQGSGPGGQSSPGGSRGLLRGSSRNGVTPAASARRTPAEPRDRELGQSI